MTWEEIIRNPEAFAEAIFFGSLCLMTLGCGYILGEVTGKTKQWQATHNDDGSVKCMKGCCRAKSADPR